MRREVNGHDEMCPESHKECGINWDAEESLCFHKSMPFQLNGQCLCAYLKDVRWHERSDVADEIEHFMTELVGP